MSTFVPNGNESIKELAKKPKEKKDTKSESAPHKGLNPFPGWTAPGDDDEFLVDL